MLKKYSMLSACMFCVMQCILSVSPMPLTALPRTLNVPSEYASIQAAVDAASNGDTVSIENGTYASESNIHFSGKVITVRSQSGNPEACIIQSNNSSNSAFWIHEGESTAAVIRGLTIIGNSGFSGNGGAMHITDAITVENCIIRNSYADKGGGVFVSNCSPVFRDCRFLENHANDEGGAVYVGDHGSPLFYNCIMARNNSRNQGEAVRMQGRITLIPTAAYPANASFMNCTIVDNDTDSDDNEVVSIDSSVLHMYVVNCIIRNPNGSGREIHCAEGALAGFLGLFGLHTIPAPVVINSLVSGGFDYDSEASSGNFDGDPLFYSANDYHLSMASPCINAGGTGTPADMDQEPRTYFLSENSDVGADEFNFCYLVENEPEGSNWFDVTAEVSGDYLVNNPAGPDGSLGGTFNTGKVRYFRINLPADNLYGTLRIWTTGSADVRGVLLGNVEDESGGLVPDCTGANILSLNDNGHSDGRNFHIDYPYTDGSRVDKNGNPVCYYLAVINNELTPSTFGLYVRLETDDRDNICMDEVSGSSLVINNSYFESGERYTLTGSVDFSDDIDHLKIELSKPGTLQITSLSPAIDAVLKDSGCQSVAEDGSGADIDIFYRNVTEPEVFLTVFKKREHTFTSPVSYEFSVVFFPHDDRIDSVTGAITGGWVYGGVETGGSSEAATDDSIGRIVLRGNGLDIGRRQGDTDADGLIDEFFYAGKQVAGDFELTANLESIQETDPVIGVDEWAVGGVMMREDTSVDSKFVLSGMTSGHGTRFRYRSTKQGIAEEPAFEESSMLPEWVRVTKEDGDVSASYSDDGITWVTTGTKTFESFGEPLNLTTHAMLAVTSHDSTRDIVNVDAKTAVSYRCKRDHTSDTDTNKPWDNTVSVSYGAAGTEYYVCRKSHISNDDFGGEEDNRPRLANVNQDGKSFDCIQDHISDDTNRPRSYYYVRYEFWLGNTYYKCISDNFNTAPRDCGAFSCDNINTSFWQEISEGDYDAISGGDKMDWSGSVYYRPDPSDISYSSASDAFWRLNENSTDPTYLQWTAGTGYGVRWMQYWTWDRFATSCDGCPAWSDGQPYSLAWKDYWTEIDHVSTGSSPYVTDWSDGSVYETGQYAIGTFSGVELDTRDIILVSGLGTETGHITTPGDRDVFEFEIDSYGIIEVRTTGCDAGEPSLISVYNRLGEKIPDNGATVSGSGDYLITERMVDDPENPGELIPVPFVVSPGTWYLAVSAMEHTDPFTYGVELHYTETGTDDHGDHRKTATILEKWKTAPYTPPLLFFNTEPGEVSSLSDTDYFRFDVPEYREYPYGCTVTIMSDYPSSSSYLPVGVRVMNTNGQILSEHSDIRVCNPDFTSDASDWVSGTGYDGDAYTNDFVYHLSGYYVCIQDTSSHEPGASGSESYWRQVATPLPVWNPTSVYSSGDTVYHVGNDAFYSCIDTASGTFTPDAWNLLNTPPSYKDSHPVSIRLTSGSYYIGITSAADEWNSGNDYTQGECVRYNDRFYRCTLSTASTQPPDEAIAYWDPVTVDYKLAVDLDDYGNNRFEAKPFTSYNTIPGHIETTANEAFRWSGDADAFELLVPYQSMAFTIYTTGESDTYGVLKNAAGETLAMDADSGEGSNFRFETPVLTANTIYYIELSMQDGSERPVGDYLLHIDQTDDWRDQWNDTSVTIGNLSDSSERQGVIDRPGDIDYFYYTPTQDGRLTIQSTGSTDLTSSLYDETHSHRLSHDSDGAPDSSNFRIVYDVLAGNTCYLAVKSQFVLETGNYLLDVTFEPADSGHYRPDRDGDNSTGGNEFATARQLDIASGTGSYENAGIDMGGDYDHYWFDVEGPGVLTVYTTGNTDTYGYLFRYEGGMYNRVATNDDSDYDSTDGFNFGIRYNVTADPFDTTRFYVRVRGFSSNETGAYNFYILFTGGVEDDHGNSCREATQVRPGNAGIIQESDYLRLNDSNLNIAGDIDYFKIVSGPSGSDPGTVSVYSTDGTVAVDTFGYLKNEMCGTIAMNDNGSFIGDSDNFRVSLTPDCIPQADCRPAAYYVAVRSHDGIATGLYNLHVISNGVAVGHGSTTTMPVAGNSCRYFGFDVERAGSYFGAYVPESSVSGITVGDLDAVLYYGDGTVISDYGPDPFPIYTDELNPGNYFIRVCNNSSLDGQFDLALTCSEYGEQRFGINGTGSYSLIRDYDASDDRINETVSVTGQGSDLEYTSDEGYFVYKKTDDGFDYIVRINFTSGIREWAKAGIMMRDGLGDSAKNVFSLIACTGADGDGRTGRTQYRLNSGDATQNYDSVTLGQGGYVRLFYNRDTNRVITGYSSNGVAWTTNSTLADFTSSGPVYVGVAVSSHDSGAETGVTFSDISYVKIPRASE